MEKFTSEELRTSPRLLTADFIQDKGYIRDTGGYYVYDMNGISSRNNLNSASTPLINSNGIVNATVNDVSANVICGNPSTSSRSCRTYVAVATDAGVSVINETDQKVINYDTASGADVYSVQLTKDGTLYYSEAKNDEVAVFTNIQTDTADQTSADRTYDETTASALWSAAPRLPVRPGR